MVLIWTRQFGIHVLWWREGYGVWYECGKVLLHPAAINEFHIQYF